ncbi:MAG: hypothetical protein KTR28_05870 [Micavibrio sp.]|nr:hypothetical protein [Micavibrio sp.]
MSEISRALTKLNRAVYSLEGAAEVLESKLVGEQRDMFASPAVSAPANANAKIDKTVVKKSLDLAINKIEEILADGEKAHG